MNNDENLLSELAREASEHFDISLAKANIVLSDLKSFNEDELLAFAFVGKILHETLSDITPNEFGVRIGEILRSIGEDTELDKE